MVTRHRDTGRAKGCFVEFRTQRDLAEALKMDGMDLLRRSVRIQVAEPRQGGGRGPRDGGFFGGPPRSRGGGDDFGDGFSQGGPRRGGPPGGGRGGFSRFDDEGSRGGSGRWNAVRDVPVVEAQSPRERPKLNLQPRTQSAGLDAASGGALGEGATKSNPFGSAKPADTAAKLQELELRDAEQRKEAAAKRREEAEAARAPESAPATAPPAPPPAPAESTPAAQAEDQGGEFTAAGQRGGPVGGRGGRGAGRSDRGRVGGGPGRGRDRDRPPPGIGRPGSGSGGDGTLPHHRQGESLGRGGRGRGGRGDRPRGDAPGKAPRQVLAPTEDDVPKTKVANPYDLLATDE